MKKLKIWLFLLFVFFAGIYAIAQSDFTKTWVKNLITSTLQEEGLTVQIGSVQGTFPHQIDLKNVSVTGHGVDLTFEEISMRPILWRLLKKEVAFEEVHARGDKLNFDGTFKVNKKWLVVDGKLEDWILYTRIDLPRNTAYFRAKNPLLQLKGKALFDSEFSLIRSDLRLSSDQILSELPLKPKGRVIADLVVTKDAASYKGDLKWKIPVIAIDHRRLKNLSGTGLLFWKNQNLSGDIFAGSLAKAKIDLTLLPNFKSQGKIDITVENIQSLNIPNIYGKLETNITFEPLDIQTQSTATSFYLGPFFAQKVTLSSKEDVLKVGVEKGKWNELEISHAELETHLKEKTKPFRLFGEGKWNHPLEIEASGSWQNSGVFDIQTLKGTFYQRPFALKKALLFEMTDELFSLPNLELALGDASGYLNIYSTENKTLLELTLNQFPLDVLSLNPLDVNISGRIDLKAKIEEKNEVAQGTLTSNIYGLDLEAIGIEANGHFEGNLKNDLLSLKGSLIANEKPMLDLELNLPMQLNTRPFSIELLTHKNAKGQINLDGRVEDFLDFVDLGPHRLTGMCHANLKFGNTLYRPIVEGEIDFQDGVYENYFTGTNLRDIQANIQADKETLHLTSLSAKDLAGKGTLAATGELLLLESDHYPFKVDAQLNNLKFVEIDLVQASLNGEIHLEGNTLSSLAKGNLEIIESNLTIPDHIRKPLPDLQVTYRNTIHPVAAPSPHYTPNPLALDLQITTPQLISVSGKGLSSEWKGDFHLGGTFTTPAARGKLELVSGEFNFSSRSFKLTDGSLSLSGLENEMPYLNLAGSMETKGITVTARLKGPLDNPQITLQSSPPLPLGSIMSYLLFGQDVSDIGGFQALQLASSLASFAGAGPDVLESTRKSLGIDRLRIITDPNEEGGETISLQVGKYVTEDVLITFTQGTEDSGPNISAEVELKHNFVFQIESDQRQEQGKFTLKWNRNY